MQTLTGATLLRNTLRKLARAPYVPWRSVARDKQLAPPGDWSIWLLLAGRGFGKTRSIVEFAHDKAEALPGSRGAIVGPTTADVRDVLVEGPSGLKATARPNNPVEYEPSRRRVTWRNGSSALLFSADEPRQLRGPQHHWAIADEVAAWRFPDAFDQLLFGLRLGDNPQLAIATTPRPTALIKRLVIDPTVHVTRGTTYENAANLAKPFIDQLMRRYEGTTLGRQELEGAILDDLPGALWDRATLERNRVTNAPPLVRIVVGVDPAVTVSEDSSETGIIAAGIDADGHGYVLDDSTLSGSPDTWAKAAVAVYHKLRGDRIVAEVNNGGDMVLSTIRTVDANVSVKQVRASRGKYTRAEPVAALYEQGRVHHLGMFGPLEDQLCSWLVGDKSPDRLDALVWAVTELMLGTPAEIVVDTAPDFLTNWRG